jgi:H+-transporting ATPase
MNLRPSDATAPTADTGLSTYEAAQRLAQCGPNAMPEEDVGVGRRILRHFWAPVPWMLEATIALQLAIGERLEALMVATLLIANVALGVFQESRAGAALALLKQRLTLRVRAKRDGNWVTIAAAELVPGDIVQISLGGVVPADLQLISGVVLLDQSTLTGESIPVEASTGATAFAGALVRRGEAIGEVIATGTRTYFGRAAELVRIAHVDSSEQHAVLGVVRNLTIVNFAIVVAMVAYAHGHAMGFERIIPLVLTAMLAAVPVALPATFTLAATLGAKTLALKGVLLTRLNALHEAAMIDVLCADKTGTLTENALTVSAVRSLDARYSDDEVLALAAIASSPDGQDPVDTAIRSLSASKTTVLHSLTAVRFTPFDPATKKAEALVIDGETPLRIVKGAPAAIEALAPMTPRAEQELESLAQSGSRILGVACGPPAEPKLVGLIAISDPPRADSPRLLAELRGLGVRPLMVSGDTAATAASVARAIGLEGPVCPPGGISDRVHPEDFAVFAGVFPEDKFRLVKAFQQEGHAVGMCGDGANDAPALRQAQMGIAVATATDVAKAAAGLVLTEPGLGGIVACIAEGRSAFQRVLTYTLSILINKCVNLIVLGAGLIITGHAVLTPMLQALSMLAGDIVTMSRAADRAKPTPYPNAWRVRNLTLAAIPLGLFKLAYCIGVLAAGWFWLDLDFLHMRTLTFAMLVFAGQANVYVLRERGPFWHSRPAPVMLLASLADVALVTALVLGGILVSPLSPAIVGMLALATSGFAVTMDGLKRLVFRRFDIDRRPS